MYPSHVYSEILKAGGMPEGHWLTCISRIKKHILSLKQWKLFPYKVIMLAQAVWALYLLVRKGCPVASNLFYFTRLCFPCCLHCEIVCTGAPVWFNFSPHHDLWSHLITSRSLCCLPLSAAPAVHEWGARARHFKDSEWTSMSVSPSNFYPCRI